MDRSPLDSNTARESKSRLWAGRVMTGLAALFLIVDGAMKQMNIAPVRDGMTQLGFPASLAPGIGIVLLICVALYVIPRTSVLGAVLLTGYLGGAVAAQVRVGKPLFGYILFPVYVALVLWGGLYLRDERLRALIPIRSNR